MGDLNNLDTEFMKSYLPILRNLRCSGLYFFGENSGCLASKHPGLLRLIYFFIVLGFHIGGVVQKFSEEAAFTKISIHLAICLVFVEGIIIQVHLMSSRKSIRNYIITLEAEWRNNTSLNPDQIRDKDMLIQKFCKLSTGFFNIVYVFSLSYITTPFIWNMVNEFAFGLQTRHTPFYYEVGFDFRSNFLVFLCIYVFDGVAIICVGWLVLTDLWLITATMSNLYILFMMLHHDIKALLMSNPKPEEIELQMPVIVKRHIKLLKLLDGLSSPFGAIFAIHIAFLSATIAFYGITAMIEKDFSTIKDAIASVLIVVYLYQSSYYGQLLTESSFHVSMVAYNTAWYKMDNKYQKMIFFIMLRAQKPRYITSGYLTNISLTTFTRMMNSTWSFLSLLLTMFDS